MEDYRIGCVSTEPPRQKKNKRRETLHKNYARRWMRITSTEFSKLLLLSLWGDRFDWLHRLDSQLRNAARLRPGWNGYKAPAPSPLSIEAARNFLESLHSNDLEPSRAAPAAVGGIGITIGEDDKQAYVEFGNNGQGYAALYSLADEDDPIVWPVPNGAQEVRQLIEQLRDYLDVGPSSGPAS